MSNNTYDDELSAEQGERAEQAQHPPNIIGGYTILHELGTGGMGTVYAAEQHSLKRHVALKVLAPHLSMTTNAIQRFKREGEAAGRNQHPNIVSIIDVGEENGVHFIVQELVEGPTLKARLAMLRAQETLPENYYREVTTFLIACCHALQSAHDGGVIHRDIKPENILIAADETPKIADFGLALVVDELSLSRTGLFAGTPHYMSPEQAASHRMGIDHRSDIFSLGITLYEMLTLQRAFTGDTAQQVVSQILLDDPVYPTRLRSKIPADLSAICMKAIEKNRKQRYPSMTAFADDLERYLKHEPILARAPGPIRRLAKWSVRHPVWSVALSVAAISMITIVTLLFKLEQSRQHLANEAVTAEASLDFLVDVIESSDPYATQGSAPTVQTLLDTIEGRIDERLKDEPEARLRLLTKMASVYTNLSQPDKALPAIKEAQSLALEFRPDDLIIQINLLDWLAISAQVTGDFPAAEDARLKGLSLIRTEFGTGSKQEAKMLNNMGNLYMRMGNFAQAEEHLSTSLEVFHAIGTDIDRKVIIAIESNLGGIYFYTGQLAKSEQSMLSVLAQRREVFPAGHPDIADSLINIASLHMRQEQYDAALPLLIEAHAIRTAAFGEENANTFEVIGLLAGAYAGAGQDSVAEEHFFRAIAGLKRTTSVNNPTLLGLMSNCAIFYSSRDRAREASVLNRQVYQTRLEVFGQGHHETLNSLNNLVFDLIGLEEWAEAEIFATILLGETSEDAPTYEKIAVMVADIQAHQPHTLGPQR
jgi:serine/threonine protein kinase